ncbi:PREDICTED: ankyrin repeat domain-containing protein 34C-like [Branchiostoma belcheri]|uniref:Ankyrin repeat domain-containing protein 34C-like n=1 Tax=Branchiostoma belcheri TaxID=7741 RepID=A0A6P4XM60_BRABE|nr:PREDICTED: ankyrin repeat domain-containing protein 34C-like [Branchiostoma belcheri]
MVMADGSSLNMVKTEGNALLKAAWLRRLRLARLLIEGGADVNAANEDGQNALMIACMSTYKDDQSVDKAKIVRYLLDNKADVNCKDKAGRTALIYACKEKAGADVVQLLLRKEADPRIEDSPGSSALVYAVNSGDVRVLKLLINACKEKGKEVILITTTKSNDTPQCEDTKQYLYVPKSLMLSPPSRIRRLSPSDINCDLNRLQHKLNLGPAGNTKREEEVTRVDPVLDPGVEDVIIGELPTRFSKLDTCSEDTDDASDQEEDTVSSQIRRLDRTGRRSPKIPLLRRHSFDPNVVTSSAKLSLLNKEKSSSAEKLRQLTEGSRCGSLSKLSNVGKDGPPLAVTERRLPRDRRERKEKRRLVKQQSCEAIRFDSGTKFESTLPVMASNTGHSSSAPSSRPLSREGNHETEAPQLPCYARRGSLPLPPLLPTRLNPYESSSDRESSCEPSPDYCGGTPPSHLHRLRQLHDKATASAIDILRYQNRTKRRGSGTILMDEISQTRPGILPPLNFNPKPPIPDIGSIPNSPAVSEQIESPVDSPSRTKNSSAKSTNRRFSFQLEEIRRLSAQMEQTTFSAESSSVESSPTKSDEIRQ